MSLFNFIKQQLSITNIISDYVTIKRAGNYWKGPCPFHFEKDASFTVSPDKQIYYCFGCHAGGDIISFIAKAEVLTHLPTSIPSVSQSALNILPIPLVLLSVRFSTTLLKKVINCFYI